MTEPVLSDVLKVANLQWNIQKRNFPENLAILDRLIEKAVGQSVQVISLPEMWSQSFCRADLLTEAGNLEHRLETLGERARRHHLWIAGGTLPEIAGGGKVYNTFHLLDPSGKVRYRFRKANLFPAAHETEFFSSPPEPVIPPVFASGLWRVGAGICFDIRFPDLFQTQRQNGANLFFIPAQIPRERLEHFILLSRARALENMACVVATNRCGEGGRSSFPGNSLIIDPLGNPVSQLGDQEECGIGIIDANRLLQTRETMPFLTGNGPAAVPRC